MLADDATLSAGHQLPLVRQVKLISWLSLVWMTTEGVIGVIAGIAAGSIALLGYGLDSTITGVASAVIIWRFTGDRLHSQDAEARAQRVVAITFFLLVPYVSVEAVRQLASGHEAEPSWVGIGLGIVSTVAMPLFGRAKKRIGNQLDSPATTGEGTQNILCGYLSLAILAGLGANALLGVWWADPTAALIVAAAALRTGIRTWQGKNCSDVC